MLNKYSFGIGDRFAHQGIYQLKAFISAAEQGIDITPVWNKSHREHITIGSKPNSVLAEAKDATQTLDWEKPFLVDADHINFDNVDPFLNCSDFFTIDVGKYVGNDPDPDDVADFKKRVQKRFPDSEEVQVTGLSSPVSIADPVVDAFCNNFLVAFKQASRIYQYILEKKNGQDFMVEISIDEVEEPQDQSEFLLLLLAVSEFGIPIDTIAPKFIGDFYKGVDYVGDTDEFALAFEDFIILLDYAADQFEMSNTPKLSVHTGSDKFSLYPIINTIIKKHDSGLHLKTAGTTWLEEAIGLAESGGEALEFIKALCLECYQRFDELTVPYSNVLNVKQKNLPSEDEIRSWDGKTLAHTLRHDQSHPLFNPDLRQLVHTGYKIAAEHGTKFTDMLEKNAETIGEHVFTNILQRHMKPLFF